jgi:hypothetical protein
MTQKPMFSLFVTLWLTVSTAAQTAPTPQAKVNVIIDREAIRFAPQELAQELRLVVTDQAGAELYDSGLLAISTLDWAMRDSKGEAVKGGLYLYTLSIKNLVGETSQRRGYLIINRTGDADRVYVATSDKVGIGAGGEASTVTVVGSPEATVGGAELPVRGQRGEASDERSSMQRDTSARRLAEQAEPAQKNSAGGLGPPVKTNIPDDLVVNGNLIFTPAPARDITMQNNNFGLRFYGAPELTSSPAAAAIQFWGNNSNFPGQLYLDAGATNLGALIFRTAPTGGTIAERMRVTAGGNVGIGTTAPINPLDVVGSIRSFGNGSNDIIAQTDGGTNAWARMTMQTQNQRWSLGTSQNFNGDQFYIYDFTNNHLRMTIQPNGGVVAFPTFSGGGRILMGEAGCGAGFGGIGFAPTLAGCANYALLGNATNTFVSRPAGGGLYFREANSDQLTITTGGSVGIGTINPDSKLTIVGAGANGYSLGTSGNVGVGGNAIQTRDKGGLVKAMVYVNGDGTILRCYNGQTGESLTGGTTNTGCGFSVTHFTAGGYGVNFGFQVNDRFVSVTPAYFNFEGELFIGSAGFFFPSPSTTSVDVRTSRDSNNVSTEDVPFMIIVY